MFPERMNEQPADMVYCEIEGVTRPDLWKIMQQAGYGTATSSLTMGILETGLLTQKTLASEDEFTAEHERLIACTRQVSPTATVETRYYPAGESLPRFQAHS